MTARGDGAKVKRMMSAHDVAREQRIKSTVEWMSGFPTWIDFPIKMFSSYAFGKIRFLF